MNYAYTSGYEKSMIEMIEFLHKKVKDSKGKVIGHDECKIPGIVEILFDETRDGHTIEIEFVDGTTWYFDRSN